MDHAAIESTTTINLEGIIMPRKKRLPTISEQLLEAVQGCGMSAQALGARCGVSQPIITRWIAGERGITIATADKLAACLGMELTRPVKLKV